MFFKKKQQTPEAFRRKVDKEVARLGLNPDLPEIEMLKAAADRITINGTGETFLKMLDPMYDTKVDAYGRFIVQERWFGYVLNLWSIARHLVPNIDERLTKIMADYHGTHLYVDGAEAPIITFSGPAIDPRRIADPGNRYEVACAVIKEFTDMDMNFRMHVGRTESMVLTKGPSGHWLHSFKQLQSA